jgi:hypothetical protein
MLLTKQLTETYTVDGNDYTVHISAAPVDDTFYRTTYRFRFLGDEKDTMFYCFTSEHFEVVFRYVIEAKELFGDDWKKRLKFDFRTKQLFLDDQLLPV